MNNLFEIKDTAINYLKKNDIRLGRLIDNIGAIKREVIKDPFTALVQSIVFQQLAFAAANTIWNRLVNTIGIMSPYILYEAKHDDLRKCGLSNSKIEYIKNISISFIDESITNEFLMNSADAAIIDELVKIKGIGTWTAKMFLIFSLQHENVFSYKDLGLRRGVQWLYNLKNEPTESFCNALMEKWQPYSTITSLYLWEITINNYFKHNANQLLYPYLENETNNISYYDSPIGTIEFHTSTNGIEKLIFIENKDSIVSKDSYFIEEVKKQLSEYFDGSRKIFDLPVYHDGTIFQNTVWQALETIKYGITKTYGEIATIVGNPKASRAVGNSNNKNKISIITPCHRVIGANGKLTGYAGGLDRKKWLLNHEKMNI